MNLNFGIELNDDAAQMIAGGNNYGYDKKKKHGGYYVPSIHLANAEASADAYGKNTAAFTYTSTKTTPYSSSAYSSSTSATFG